MNLEVFGIATGADVSDAEWVTSGGLTSSDVTDNSEIELTIDQAEALGQSLIAAANAARSQ